MNMGPDIEWGAGVGSLTVVGFVDLAGKVEQDLSIFCEFKNHVRARDTSTRAPDAPARTATSLMAAKVSTPGQRTRTNTRPTL